MTYEGIALEEADGSKYPLGMEPKEMLVWNTVMESDDRCCKQSVVGHVNGLWVSTSRSEGDVSLWEHAAEVPAKASILGREYRTVSIGGMTWMAENLRAEVEGSFASDSEYEERYGRLYTWYAAMEAAVKAQGWHLPSKSEWDALAAAVGGAGTAGTKLKATTFSGGTDDYGFSALPAGGYYSGSSDRVGSYGSFWTSTEYSSSNAYYRYFYSGASMSSDYNPKTNGRSVRLVKDA